MDKKMLLIIFSVISLLIIGGYIYVSYNKLNNRIDLLEKEILNLTNENICKNNTNNREINNNSKISNDIDSEESIQMIPEIQEQFTAESQQELQQNISNTSSESQSLETTRNEVLDLEAKLKDVENLIQDDSNSQGELDYEVLDQQTTGRIDSILDDSTKYNSILNSNSNKQNSSEFDDLENVPNESNSELNDLINREAALDGTELEMHSNIIAENMSEDNVHSLEQINTSDQSLEDAKNIIEKTSNESFNDLNDNQSDKQEIEITVLREKYSHLKVKQLKEVCANNNLSQSGNKHAIIDRIIQNGLLDQLENSSNSVKLSENLTQ